MTARRAHPMPFGAEVRDDGVRFRLWASKPKEVVLVLEGAGRELPMEPQGEGWFECFAHGIGAGERYRFRLPDGMLVPDPASRHQPEGAHGPSEVIAPLAHPWTDGAWWGRPWRETVLYEAHAGAFANGFDGARRRLDHVAKLGATAIELLPIADFPGRRNWGYDGVLPYAPAGAYGRPEDLKRLIEEAHARGLMMILDVVYNHLGPDGNYIWVHSPAFFDRRIHTPWGPGPAFRRKEVRDYFIHSALYWLEEFHFDGLRLDAVDAIEDSSDLHFLDELAERVRRRFTGEREVHLILENRDNDARRLARDQSGRPRLYTAQWNEDVHHPLQRLLTGQTPGYYRDYDDNPRDWLARALAEGFGYQGEASAYQGGQHRGEPCAHLPPTAFIPFLQNHDEVGNRPKAERITDAAPPEAVRAGAAIILLSPQIPLLFMGEEWGAASPFPFFCDFDEKLGESVRKGRLGGFKWFGWGAEERQTMLPPNAQKTYDAARLDWTELERAPHGDWLAFHRELLAIRAREIVPRLDGIGGNAGTYEIWGTTGLSVTWAMGDGSRLTLAANLGQNAESGCPKPKGGVLYQTANGVADNMGKGKAPPWSAAFFLDNQDAN